MTTSLVDSFDWKYFCIEMTNYYNLFALLLLALSLRSAFGEVELYASFIHMLKKSVTRAWQMIMYSCRVIMFTYLIISVGCSL